MSTESIPTGANGVRGGHPRRGHRRSHASHGHTSISYPGYLSPLDLISTTVTEEAHPEADNAAYSVGLAQPPSIPPNGATSGMGDMKADEGYTYSGVADKGHDHDSGDVTDRLFSREALYSVLIPVPYAIAQFLVRSNNVELESHHLLAEEAVVEDPIQDSGPGSDAFLKSCALASTTLVLLGLLSTFQKQWFRTDASKSAAGLVVSQLGMTKLQSTVIAALSIGLPFYSALLLDSGRAATGILIAYASEPSLLFRSSSQGSIYKQLMTLLKSQKAAIGCLLAMLLLDAVNVTSAIEVSQTLRGYIALFLSAFVIQPPLRRGAKSGLSDGEISSSSSGVSSAEPPTASDSDIRTLKVGAVLGCITLLGALISGVLQASISGFLVIILTGLCSAVVFGINPSLLSHRPSPITVAAGLSSSVFASIVTLKAGFSQILVHASFSALAFASIHLDSTLSSTSHSHHHHHKDEKQVSKLTKFLLARFKGWPFIYGILKEKDSRRIFYFMSLNFGFMLIQMTYGIITGSLGLLSDSVHMLFDCFALLVGLCAAVMSKWPPSARFPYGYGKVDTLAGFANGVFLMIISVEIVYEAIERLMSGSEMQRLGELLVVSTAGLAVNMVGIMAFDHGHHHGHSHSHGGHDHDSSDPHPHHTNENMHGIFLHILADTLGSVAVVISTILVHFYGWPGFDPIASCMIAILIFVSAIPLVTSTSKTLLLALPADVEYNLRDTLAGVSALRGVVGYTVPKFWLDDTVHDHKHKHDHGHDHEHAHGCSGHSHSHSHGHHHHHSHSHSHSHSDSHTHDYHDHGHSHKHDHSEGQRVLGVMHVIASRTSDLEDVRQRTINYLREKDMDILIQVEREGEGKCWCGGGNKAVS